MKVSFPFAEEEMESNCSLETNLYVKIKLMVFDLNHLS